MYMPDIHSCGQLSAENDYLKTYIKKLREKNAHLKSELDAIKQQTSVSTRSIETQTDNDRKTPSAGLAPVRGKTASDSLPLCKLLALHDSLMRRHEKEVQSNQEHVETITALTLKVNDLERKLHDLQTSQPGCTASKPKPTGTASKPTGETLGKVPATECACDHHRVLVAMTADKNLLEKKYRKLKLELQQLSPGFFEEIEDLKFALQQTTLLNKEFEKTLRRICHQFGLPYPHPERSLP